MNKFLALLVGLLSITILSYIVPGYFSAADLLNNLPSYAQGNFIRPKNSLLADPVVQFGPWLNYEKRTVCRGKVPLWNPFSGLGSPFLANPQTAVFYPLHLSICIFPERVSLFFIFFGKIFLLFFFMYLYLGSIKLARLSRFVGSSLLVTSSFFLMWVQWPKTNVYLLFPLLLFITEKIAQNKKKNHRWFIFFAITYFFAVTGGHPETLFHLFILQSTYAVWRLWGNRRTLLGMFLSALVGFLLASFILVPFVEYLLNSFVYFSRSQHPLEVFLPKQSSIFYFVPFLFGAPHTQFYKPIADGINFQETAGGYVGVITFLLGIFGAYFYRDNRYIRFWSITVVGIWLFIYGVWPFSLLQQLPLLSMSMNVRLIGFASFGIITLFALVFDKLRFGNLSFVKKNTHILLIIGSIVFLVCLSIILVLPSFFHIQSKNILEFIPYLQIHTLFLLFSSLSFFLFLLFLIQRKHTALLWAFLAIPIFLQTIVLFWNYNPVISADEYYPETELIRQLSVRPKGPVLEVGNMNLPEDIPLVYGIQHLQNYDALEIKEYRTAFDKAFPVKNRWGRVEDVTANALTQFGVRYVVSDFDIRLEKEIVHPAQRDTLPPLHTNVTAIRFTSVPHTIAVRLMFATFNRKNTCSISVNLWSESTKSGRKLKSVFCQNVSNFMYYTIPFKDEIKEKGDFTLFLSPVNASPSNSIALVGLKNTPYLDLLYRGSAFEKFDKLHLVWGKNNVYLWELPDYSPIVLKGSYKILSQDAQKIRIDTTTTGSQKVEIKIPYYPGWHVYIDAHMTSVINNNPFIAVLLPAGKHVLEFTYEPFSFTLGLSTSLVALAGVLIYLYREERNRPWYAHIVADWKKRASVLRERYSWSMHAGIFLIIFISTAFSYLTFLHLFPLPSVQPETTAINWFTVHVYPIQTDYLRFLLGVPFVLGTTFLIWIIIIWRKSK